MCGFFQVVQRSEPVSRERFERALSTLQHRGPDATGVHFSDFLTRTGERCFAASGHQRLSILDLGASANQPFVRDSQVLLYNGEIYNYAALRDEQLSQGRRFETHGDTEVLMHALMQSGSNCLQRMNGMWAFSLLNESIGRISLGRDRYGKKPLFYYLDDSVFCVASSIRAIKTYTGQKLSFRRDPLLRYLLFGTLYPSATGQTHLEGINQILPGHTGQFDCASWALEQTPYFNWHTEIQTGSGDNFNTATETASQDLIATLSDSVASRLVSDRPIALLLSGGVDSSLLLSILVSMGLEERVNIFMGDTGRSDDYAYARQCVEHLGVKAQSVQLDYDENTFERFMKICWHHEKPFPLNGNAMAMPQMFEVIAEQGIPVVLDGSGGDELFGGYWERHMPFAMREAVRQKNWPWIRSMLAANGRSNRVRQNLVQAFLPASLVNGKRVFQRRLKSQLHPLIRASMHDIWHATDTDPMNTHTPAFSHALSLDVAPGGRLGEWIWHNDRNSMMSSVESRSPLLDYRLHRFLFSGYSNKYHAAWNKYELRKAFDHFRPLPTQWRQQKQGFRWDGKHFILNNKDRIIDLIASSDTLAEVLNLNRLVSLAKKHPKLLRSSIGKQALSIAGIEYTLLRH